MKFMRDFNGPLDIQLVGLLCSVRDKMNLPNSKIAQVVSKQFTQVVKENKRIVVQATRNDL